MQDAAYGTLLRSRRQELHARVAAKISQPSLLVADEDNTVVRDMYTGAFNALEKTMLELTKKVLLPRTGHR